MPTSMRPSARSRQCSKMAAVRWFSSAIKPFTYKDGELISQGKAFEGCRTS